MRPTIPLAEWRIASDLPETRAVGRLIPAPPCTRECPWCRNWTVAHASVLADSVAVGLQRLGLVVTEPADLYAYAEPDQPGGAMPYHLTFYAAGPVRSSII